MAFDSSGNLWATNQLNSAALEFTPPFTVGENASVVIGKQTLTPAANVLLSPVGITFDSGNLWVDDSLDGRVLAFAPPFTDGENASVVIGRPDFASGGALSITPTTQSGLRFPQGIAFDQSGNLWVADSHNNRVVEFAAAGSGTSTTSSSSTSTSGPSLAYSMQVNISYEQQQLQSGGVDVKGNTQFSLAIMLNQTGGSSPFNLPIALPQTPGTLEGWATGNGTYTATIVSGGGSCSGATGTRNYNATIRSQASPAAGTVGFQFYFEEESFVGNCVSGSNSGIISDLIDSCFDTVPADTNGGCSSFPINGGTNRITMGPTAGSGTSPYKSISGSATLTLVSSSVSTASSTSTSSSSVLTAPEFQPGALAVVVLISIAVVAVISRRAGRASPAD